MARDLWLVYLQYFDEETDANFVVSHQVDQAQTRAIREGFEQYCTAVFFGSHRVFFATDS